MQRAYTLALLVMILASCGPDAAVRVARYTDQRFDSTTHVDVLDAPPARPHTPVAELTVSAGGEPILALKERARKLGADAIILTGEHQQGAIAAPVGGYMVVNSIRVRTALAIRYDDR